MIQMGKPWSLSNFQHFSRARLRVCGVGDGDSVWYTGHSIKQGTIQLEGLGNENVAIKLLQFPK